VRGQPNLNIKTDREKAARYGLNVGDANTVVQAALGGTVATTLLEADRQFGVVVRLAPQYRSNIDEVRNIKVGVQTPQGNAYIPLSNFANITLDTGASYIFRERNQRFVPIKFSVRGRDLAGAVEEAQERISRNVKLPPGYRIDWAGEYASQQRAQRRLEIVIPLTLLVIFMILYSMFGSLKWATLILMTVAMAPIGGILALFMTGTNFSVSSGIGFLALFGVSVQTGVIMVEYINQLRARGYSVDAAARNGAIQRFRPILMTMLVASLGLLPAAMSHGIGSDSQRPFAIVIVGGLMAVLMMSIFLLPCLYVWLARDGDALPAPDHDFAEQE